MKAEVLVQRWFTSESTRQEFPVQYLERSFGYTKDERGVFVADEAEAVWVRKIYKMAAEGYTPASIKRYLNENGIKTVGGVQWVDSTVFRLLENEIYKGITSCTSISVNEERKLVRNRGEWMHGTSKMTMKLLFPGTLAESTGMHWLQRGLSCGRLGDRGVHRRKLSLYE